MNKPLVVVTGHKTVKKTIERHWPYFKRSGADLCGAASENTPDLWPEKIPLIDLGPEQGRGGDVLCRNFITTLREFLNHPELQEYDSVAICEYDCVFVAPLPPFSGGFRACLAGGPYPGLKANNFWHPIWQMDRAMACRVIIHGTKMIQEGDTEKGFTDFFVGRINDLHELGIVHFPGIYSQNTMEVPACQEQCRLLIQEKRVFFVHGIKTKEQLDATIPPLP